MNIEKFKLWKLALSTIHIDGKVTTEEEEWFSKTILTLENHKLLKFSSDQILELKSILKTPVLNIMEEFEKLENPADCSFLLYILRVVGYIDGDYGAEEKELFTQLEKACLKNVNIDLVKSKVELIAKESYHEDNVYRVNNKHSILENIFKSILRFLNPGDYKFPDD